MLLGGKPNIQNIFKLEVMGELTQFNFVSLNGLFKKSPEDVSWAHSDEETDEYDVEMNLVGAQALIC